MSTWLPSVKEDGFRYYGSWAGNERGYREDRERCAAEVSAGSVLFKQCDRKRGHGENGLFCKQHAKAPTFRGGGL